MSKIIAIILIVITLALISFTVIRAWPLVEHWQELRAKEKRAEELAEAEKFLEPDSDRVLKDATPKEEKPSVFEVTASSYLTDPKREFDYSPKMTIDENTATSWVEADEGDGIGEWIKFEFLKSSKVGKLKIWPGYATDKDIYFKNNRLKKIQVEFSHDTAQEFELTDEYKEHEIALPGYTTDYIKITIKSVWPGSKFKDTCLAEVKFE